MAVYQTDIKLLTIIIKLIKVAVFKNLKNPLKRKMRFPGNMLSSIINEHTKYNVV